MPERVRLTDRIVKAQAADGSDRQIFDEEVHGFALRVYRSGSKAFTLDYRSSGRPRRYTIGRYPDWTTTAARNRARELRREIEGGADPLGRRETDRAAPTVSDLIDRYEKEHLPRLTSERHKSDQKSMLRKLVEPAWGRMRVDEVTASDVEALLAKVAEGRARPAKKKDGRKKPLRPARPTPVRANRCGEIIRKAFGLAVKWGWCSDNPASGFYRRLETEREVFLVPAQINRLAAVLEEEEDQRGADIVRMLLLTGARVGEVRCAKFDQFNLDLLIWAKPAATVKQRRIHRLPISEATAVLVRHRRAVVGREGIWLFPGDVEGQPVQDMRWFWRRVQKKAGIDLTMRDLRHTFASLLVSGGASLEMIGKLLGHSQTRTTLRYAHLMDSPLRHGVDAVASVVSPKSIRLVQD